MPTLLPSAIVSQSGLYGSLAALADDPASPDSEWLTVVEPTGAAWYVKAAGSGTNGDGTSYATAWVGFANVGWGSIEPGDTLYLAGTFANENTKVGASGEIGARLKIVSCETQYGASTDDPGILFAGKARPAANWVDDGDGAYKITTSDNVTSNLVISEDLILLNKADDRAGCVAVEDSWAKVDSTFYYNPSGTPKTLYFYMQYEGAFDFNERSYITLRGVEMYGAPSSRGVCIVSHVTDASTPTGIVIDECTVAIAPYRGIHIDPPGTLTGLTVTDCIGFDCGAFLYLVSGQGAQFTITGNEIYHTANYKANSLYNVGTGDENQIAFWGGVTELLIQDNYLHDIRGMGINLYLGGTSNMQNAVVNNNRVYIDGSDSTRYNCGILLTGTNSVTWWERFSNATISNNEISGANISGQANYAAAIRIKGGAPPNGFTDAPKVSGNVISDCYAGLWLVNNSSDLAHCGVITDNTVSDPKTGGYFVRIENGTTYTYLDIDENAYSGAGYWQWDGGTDSTTFAAWQSASGQDAASTYEA
jgi:hypothetical protein